MTQFYPVTIAMPGGSSAQVRSLTEASDVLARLLAADPGNENLNRAAVLVRDAIAGICRPKVAFAAFIAAAQKQRVILPTDRSPAWQSFAEALTHTASRS